MEDVNFSEIAEEIIRDEATEIVDKAIPYGSGKLATESYDKAEQFLSEINE